MEVLDNKCPGCGAKIKFNPKNQLWDCEYCGSKFTLEKMKKHENASSEKANKQDKDLNQFDNYHCRNCGAEILADETVTATFCVYCGSTAILKQKIDNGRAPDFIIPFKNNKEDAALAFQKVTKNKPLMPRKFKDVGNVNKITGVYIPFWAYDVDVNGDIVFSCTDVTHWSDSRYSYTKTSRYESTVRANLEFEKVLADGSSRFNDELMDSIEPFDYSGLKEYNHAYLSGFFAEKYDVSEEDAYPRANSRVTNTTLDLARAATHHQTSIERDNQLKFDKKKVTYIMLPVWMVNINYNDKIYTFAMNGQTGRMVGNIPISIGRTVMWGLIIFCSIVAIGLAIIFLG